jgi:nitrate/TMAO reductase-like tetraheme cytochrome c subunit
MSRELPTPILVSCHMCHQEDIRAHMAVETTYREGVEITSYQCTQCWRLVTYYQWGSRYDPVT